MSDNDLIRRGDALKTADEELRRYGFSAPEGRRYDMRDAIAALPAVTVGVKLLVWEGPRKLDEGGIAYDAHTTCGHYIATDAGWFLVGQSGWFVAKSLDAAKAAAQADYEARILAALDMQPAPLRYMGQIMAECDCPREAECQAAGRCIAEGRR